MSQKILINFYVPKETKNRFDAICRVSGRTRTQVLVDLMNNHIIAAKPILESHFQKLLEADRTLAAIKAFQADVSQRVEDQEAELPPTLFWSDGREEKPYF